MEDFTINKERPWKRQSILIVENREYLHLSNEIPTNSGLIVIPIKEYMQFNENYSLLGSYMITPGMLLVQSPTNIDRYIEISQARELLTIDMVSSIMRLSQYLGATKVSIETIKIYDQSSNRGLSLNVETDVIKPEKATIDIKKNAKIELKREIQTNSIEKHSSFLNNLKNRIQLSAQFEKSEALDINKASSFLKTKKLNSISYINDLYEMRKADNKLTVYDMKISTTENLQKTFDFISKLSFPSNSIQTNYKKITNEKLEILLDIKITF